MADWKTLSRKETEDLLNTPVSKESYKMVGHSFRMLNRVGKQVCSRCGLLALNNPITEWCVGKGCNYEDHPQYKSKLKRLTKRNW